VGVEIVGRINPSRHHLEDVAKGRGRGAVEAHAAGNLDEHMDERLNHAEELYDNVIASSTQFPRFNRNYKFRGHNLILGQNSFFGILNPVTSPQKISDCADLGNLNFWRRLYRDSLVQNYA
jgi:hypothetical protein